VPIRDSSGNITGLCGIARNISEIKRLESQLQHAQKMESIGTLAGGIAHDFNNLLMGLQGNASLALLDIDPNHPLHERLKNIEEYVQSGAELTRQLLGFAMGGKFEVRPVNINNIIRTGSKMFGRTKKEIKIYRKCQKHVWMMEADHGQIEQVLLNLYVNAWQAMPEGGELNIQTENVILQESFVKPYNVKPGKYVKISVADTGIGIDATIQKRIFDPFFTTREMGRGTGLGLASAYGIITNHEGIINVHSKTGAGTTFDIYLPASEKEFMENKKTPKQMLKGSETILIVDDEQMIVDVADQMLEKMGYKVLSAGSGKEAVAIYEKKSNNIDMVILDMIMPDMSGADTFKRLIRIDPEITVLLSSGYSIDDQAEKMLNQGCKGFIQKPFNIADFSQKIREILDK
jgi:nitrogen-specific signal transduction histidine kinase/CheY-like chemotaxis protein